MKLALLLITALSAPAGAAIALLPPIKTPVKAPTGPFVPAYVNSLAVSLSQQPFFAAEMLGNFATHLQKVATMTRPEQVGEYLQNAILHTGSGRTTAQKVTGGLGKKALEPDQAAALLLANSLARPDQFEEVLSGMERLRPVWGQRIAVLMKNAEGGGAPSLLNRLRDVGLRLKPAPFPGTYNARGTLDGLFDGE
ncbi:MAG: hypothetical protein ABIJ96_13595 [Elusimicrobiota bacterium]